jgi:hypothetical protein
LTLPRSVVVLLLFLILIVLILVVVLFILVIVIVILSSIRDTRSDRGIVFIVVLRTLFATAIIVRVCGRVVQDEEAL